MPTLRAAVTVPSWLPRVPRLVAPLWGRAFALWAVWKLWDSMIPRLCGDPLPIQSVAQFLAVWEICLGIAVARAEWRRTGALLGFATMFGLIPFAFVAHARGIDPSGCSCFGGIDLPWLPWHAVIAAVLSLPFLWIYLDAERAAQR